MAWLNAMMFLWNTRLDLESWKSLTKLSLKPTVLRGRGLGGQRCKVRGAYFSLVGHVFRVEKEQKLPLYPAKILVI